MADDFLSKLSDEEDEAVFDERLAVERTELANERTFLAYVRTALTLFVAGASFIQFFKYTVIQVIGWAFLTFGILSFIYGFSRYKKLNRSFEALRRQHKNAYKNTQSSK